MLSAPQKPEIKVWAKADISPSVFRKKVRCSWRPRQLDNATSSPNLILNLIVFGVFLKTQAWKTIQVFINPQKDEETTCCRT